MVPVLLAAHSQLVSDSAHAMSAMPLTCASLFNFAHPTDKSAIVGMRAMAHAAHACGRATRSTVLVGMSSTRIVHIPW